MLRAGHQNPSRVLLVLFAIWVLSPFVALVFALIVSKDCSVLAGDAVWRDSDSHGKLFGHLRRCCLRTSQDEDRLRFRCCAPSVLAADCNHDPNGRADFSQALTSKQRWLAGLTADGRCAVERQSLDHPPVTILSSVPKCVLRPLTTKCDYFIMKSTLY